ncbi:polyprenyl synthetase family protein [Agreia sp. VKM Ac-1783]|uniref:polyprenyl synthetase family protein n=1 Tax=Agreia sp. VKM Ac-1783 TaxID=1938889 RepID=UPI000A2AB438|nr:polyprenyl synthetase family protein [Agreia sp. VKM Ac-1783]SMQ67426.1 geranylgeranyl diphosphate synthase, type I [Agreia sp. VKM Ac-1783]
MTQSTHLVSQVDTEIAEFLASREPILVAVADELSFFTDFSRDLLSGGKRFRARFCIAGWQATSTLAQAEEETAVITLAAALEVFHSAALVHDDIIDNSDTRRGMPAAHIRFAALHRDQKFVGSADTFGRASAILHGDLLLGWSDELVDVALDLLTDRGRARSTRAEFNRMRTEVTVGQYLDILEENAWPTVPDTETIRRAERVMTFKSAKYSVEAPLALGALIGGASAAQLQSLRRFGLPLGLAFQLRDDVLGVFGDAAVTGKPAGDDLREGKRTVLVALARQTMGEPQREAFDDALGRPDLDDTTIADLQQQIEFSGALESAERSIASYTTQALDALRAADLEREAVAELEHLARLLTERSS